MPHTTSVEEVCQHVYISLIASDNNPHKRLYMTVALHPSPIIDWSVGEATFSTLAEAVEAYNKIG